MNVDSNSGCFRHENAVPRHIRELCGGGADQFSIELWLLNKNNVVFSHGWVVKKSLLNMLRIVKIVLNNFKLSFHSSRCVNGGL